MQTDSGEGGGDAHPWGINVNSKTLTLQFITGRGGGGGQAERWLPRSWMVMSL